MPLRSGKAGHGFSLVEVLLAVAILACAVAAASTAVVNGGAYQRTNEARDRARLEVENRLEKLRALPFCPASAMVRPAGASLLGEVFPHAVAARNAPDSLYCDRESDGVPKGAFLTTSATGAGSVRVIAVFVTSARGGWVDVPLAAVEGFVAEPDCTPPGAALRITVACDPPGNSSTTLFALTTILADRPAGYGEPERVP